MYNRPVSYLTHPYKKNSTVPDFFILQKSIRCQSQRLDRPTTSKSIFESKLGHFNKCLCCAYIRRIAEGKQMCRSTSRLITNHFTKHEKSIFSIWYSERKNLIFCNKNFSKSKAKFSHFFFAFSFVNSFCKYLQKWFRWLGFLFHRRKEKREKLMTLKY